MAPRAVQKVFLAREQAEGAGATVRRSIGTPQMKHLTPFLMLDHFNVAPGAGFPDHPHRGQETITYLLEGAVDHEDFAGNKGTIHAGDLQFMTAGRGIVHAEMPSQATTTNIGMQLWVDLPKELKMCEPRYRDLRGHEIPQAKADKVSVKVISGKSLGVESLKDLAYTPVWLLDISLEAGGKLVQEIPTNWNAFIYILEGSVRVSDTTVDQFHNCIFKQAGDDIVLESEAGARIIFVAGIPLDQPVVQYGPFVMTSRDEIIDTMMDYQTGRNGFERAHNWESEIGKTMGRVH